MIEEEEYCQPLSRALTLSSFFSLSLSFHHTNSPPRQQLQRQEYSLQRSASASCKRKPNALSVAPLPKQPQIRRHLGDNNSSGPSSLCFPSPPPTQQRHRFRSHPSF